MLGILEAELVGNLANGQFCFKQKLLRPIDDGILDVMLTGDARRPASGTAHTVRSSAVSGSGHWPLDWHGLPPSPAGAAFPSRTVCCTHQRCLSG